MSEGADAQAGSAEDTLAEYLEHKEEVRRAINQHGMSVYPTPLLPLVPRVLPSSAHQIFCEVFGQL
jgi:hypothetical protein